MWYRYLHNMMMTTIFVTQSVGISNALRIHDAGFRYEISDLPFNNENANMSAMGNTPKLMSFTAHHKTGTVLALELASCFAVDHHQCTGFQEDESGMHWKGDVPANCDRIVNMVRSPTEVIRSAYLYHKQIPAVEAWLEESISIPKGVPLPEPHLHESYTDYLNRASTWDGLLAEMSLASKMTLLDMEEAYTNNVNNPHVMTVCLEDAFEHFTEVITNISHFIGVPLTPEISNCVAKQDPSKHIFGSHMTTGTVSEFEEGKILRYIEELDTRYFDHRFGTSPIHFLCTRKSSDSGPTHRKALVDASGWYFAVE